MNFFSNLLGKVVDVAQSVIDRGSIAGNLLANISSAIPRTTPSGAGQFRVGEGLTTQQTQTAEKVLGIKPPEPEPYLKAGIPLSSQFQTTQNIPSIRTKEQEDINKFIQTGGAGQINQPKITQQITQPTYTQPKYTYNPQTTSFNPQTGELYTGIGGESGVSAGQFGGGTGISGIEGGAQLLPQSLAGGGRFVGGFINIADLEDAKEKNVEIISTGLDFYDAITGEKVNPALTAGKRVGVLPYGSQIQVEEAPVEATADTIDNFTDVGAGRVNKLIEQLTQSVERSNQARIDFENQVKAVNESVLNAQKQLKDLELLTINEIKDITSDPDFPKTLQQRRLAFLNNPQHPYWIQRIALTNELNFAEQKKANIIEQLKLSQDIDDRTFQNNLQLLNTLRPDSLGLKTDSNGDLWNFYQDPLSGKISKVKVMGGFEKQKAYEDYKIEEIGDRKKLILIDKNGNIQLQDLGAVPAKTETLKGRDFSDEEIRATIRTTLAGNPDLTLQNIIDGIQINEDVRNKDRAILIAREMFGQAPTQITTVETPKVQDTFFTRLFSVQPAQASFETLTGF